MGFSLPARVIFAYRHFGVDDAAAFMTLERL